MDITVHSLFIWITTILIIGLDFQIITGSINRSAKVFALLSFITAIWVASQGFLISSNSPFLVDLLIRLQYVLGLIISLGFYHFSHIYPTERKLQSSTLALSGIFILIFAYLFLFTQWMITGVNEIGGNGRWAWELGPGHWLFEIAFCGLWIIALHKLYVSYRRSVDSQRTNVRNVFLALLLGIVPPTVMNILLPSIGYYELNWLGPITSIIWIAIIAYSITRHHLFSIRVIAVQLVTFALWIFILVRTILSESLQDFIIQGSLLLVTIVFGTLLIRGVLHEISQRERIEKMAGELKEAYAHVTDLNENLEKKVAEQTVKIRAAYEVEKKARAELEKLNEIKDQFITSTQHHLRTPLTSLKWEHESMKKKVDVLGDAELRNMISNADESTQELDRIIENFIQITERK